MSEKPGGGLPPSRFGVALRRVRDEKGLTQAKLAEVAGLHPNTVAKMERGEVEPSWQVVLALSKALGVDCTAFSAEDAEAVKDQPTKKPAAGPGPPSAASLTQADAEEHSEDAKLGKLEGRAESARDEDARKPKGKGKPKK